jgi:hypothetical protein
MLPPVVQYPVNIDAGLNAPVYSPNPSAPGYSLPGVSASTLLAAAALPNAPAVVRQAAAQYSAANPASSLTSGTILGMPMLYVLGAGGLLLVLAMAKKR